MEDSMGKFECELQQFVGKKVFVDLNLLSEEDVEFEWDQEYDDNENPAGGEGHINLDYREYNSDKDSEEDDEYDETDNWKIQTGLSFVVDKNSCISKIEITADISCFGDSGLGDCLPEDEWTDNDLALSKVFLESITDETT
jgi:hypothetical protein